MGEGGCFRVLIQCFASVTPSWQNSMMPRGGWVVEGETLTCWSSFFRRSWWQVGQPRPWQVGQAPSRVLKEKWRGERSPKSSPVRGLR